MSVACVVFFVAKVDWARGDRRRGITPSAHPDVMPIVVIATREK